MKKIYLFLATAALFAACASDDLSVQEQPQVQAEEGVVGFDVYTQRAITRGGEWGSLTTNSTGSGIIAMTTKGFGVFGYYTNNNEYDQRATPNFFYNQFVDWDGTNNVWKYEPVKYWPNEYGDKATSDDADLVTYFAYAPWVDIEPTTGRLKDTTGDKEQWGIISMNRNNAQGDPLIKYIASFNSKKSVDLCWGVQDYGLSSGKYEWAIVQPTSGSSSPSYQEFDNGMPWIDVKRPALGTSTEYQKVKFNFKHALAQMQIKIDADIDIKGHAEDESDLAAKTRIWVREVTFKGFVMKGTLNLHNTAANKPYWMDYNGQNDIVAEDIKVYDGRKDGKEGVAGAIATNEKTLGLNPQLIQGAAYDCDKTDPANFPLGLDEADRSVYNALTLKVPQTVGGTDYYTGVTKVQQNLFEDATGGTGIFHVIPIDGEKFEIEIVYDVETVSENLAQNLSDGQTKGTSIENRIRKETFDFNGKNALLPGHSYKINLHLGMNSVKFDAEVTPWIEEPTQDVELPSNTPKYAYADGNQTIQIPYKGEYTFALTGMKGGETITATAVRNTVNSASATAEVPTDNEYITLPSAWTATSTPARPDGVAIETLKAKTNPNTTVQTQVVKWKGTETGGDGITFTFQQDAHPLFLKGAASGQVITLTRHDNEQRSSSTDWANAWGWLCADNGTALTTNGTPDAIAPATPTNGIAVYRNGSKLNFAQKALAALAGNEFDFTDTGVPTGGSGATASTAKITVGDVLQSGDVIRVVLKTGDAPTEEITISVP